MLDLQTAPEVAPVAAMNAFAEGGDLRHKVERLESIMFEMPGHVTELPVRHIFASGLYARELTIPKGMVATGKVHCQEHLFFVNSGEISVLTESGPQRLKAPAVLVTQPGTKRVVYAHEDTVVTTVHATTETKVEQLEADLVANSYAEYEVRLLASPGV